MAGGRVVAWNERSKVIVGWLGTERTKGRMRKRLEEFNAPKYVVPKRMTQRQIDRRTTRQLATVRTVGVLDR